MVREVGRLGEKAPAINALLATRHPQDLRVFRASVPEFEENDIGGAKFQLWRPRRAIVKHVLVEQFMKTID